MSDLQRGLHETLITRALAERLQRLDASLTADERPMRREEAGDRLALHLSRCLVRAIDSLPEKERVVRGVELAQRVIDQIELATKHDARSDDAPTDTGHVLHAILKTLPSGQLETIGLPLTPLIDTTLLTNAPGEPRVGKEIAAEIASADRIDIVMAFVRFSGIRPLLEDLRRHTAAGRAVRLLTTIYTGSTEAAALDALIEAGAAVRVSYDTSRTRLHAKAWLFHRRSGFSTAYVGSSNLTQMAQVDGLEWNVRASAARNPDVVDKVRAVFESYWQDPDFVAYDPSEFTRRLDGKRGTGGITLPPTELHARPFQSRLLEQIALARARGFHRNLLVAATGTGKTVMAALDYASLIDDGRRPTLLFVAHRRELLEQALATFRHALRDPSFGERWVGGTKPVRFEHVFASIQTLREETLEHLSPTHFQAVIVDEFHHAAADSWARLLDHVDPEELLGLTATPERADGVSVLDRFDGRIAAELRLWDAIDQQRLVPFSYFGVADGTDLRQVPWQRGRGYDVESLTNVLTANDALARQVLATLDSHVPDVHTVRALGFCVSVAHARFMARVFTESGLAATAVWSDTPAGEREAALRGLAAGSIRVLFSVDLFNEGVDVPSVDTLLMLRPTQSGTLFLQQLGRGLRQHDGKRLCTVLDFIGQHRREFRFDQRFGALLGGTRREVQQQIEADFPFLPSGCHLSLDPVARDVVLNSVRNALPANWPARVKELAGLADPSITLAAFLDQSGLELDDLYGNHRCWSDLREAAALDDKRAGPAEVPLRRAIGRLLHVDDGERLCRWRAWLAEPVALDIDDLATHDHRLFRMLVASVVDQAASKGTSLKDGWSLLIAHDRVRAELVELLDVLNSRQTHVDLTLATRPEIPLRIHARYTRREILAACGVGDGATVGAWQTGVYRVEDADTDLLAFTLDKTGGGFSPTTRYRDYAISRTLLHWESQNVTREDSDTGLRYREHAGREGAILLFARERADDRAFWFLGPARYVSHEGERPMAITWRLQHPLPADLYASFAAAVA